MDSKVLKLLQCTPHQLDMLVFQHYKIWCEMYISKPEQLQLLMINNALFNWWLFQYKKLQQNFLVISEPYNSVACKREMEYLYKQETIKIKNLYPKPLLRAAIKINQEIIGNSQYN